jgi:hypothetical protein
MSAQEGSRFLPELDEVCLSPGLSDLSGVLEIASTVPAAVLVGIARARLLRQVELLDELTTMPIDVRIRLEPLASALCAALQEVAHLLEAASRRMPDAEGGAT